MARPSSRHPTDLELAILKVLWRDGPSPARQVRDALAALPGSERRDLAHTSVLTVLAIMVRKRYLRRRRVDRGWVFEARVDQDQTTRSMLADLVARAFGGSPATAALNLLETAELDDRDIQRLRDLIDSKRKERQQ